MANRRAIYKKSNLLDLVMSEVVGHTNASKEEILGRSRKRYIDTARKVFLHISYNTLSPYPTHEELGNYIKRDHATVSTSLKRTNNLMDTEQSLRELIEKVQTIVSEKLYL